jgi:hypothetical protein
LPSTKHAKFACRIRRRAQNHPFFIANNINNLVYNPLGGDRKRAEISLK